MPETTAPTLPDAIDGASTPAMPPARKFPHHRWDVSALSPEQGDEAKHESPRDVDQHSSFDTIVDHESISMPNQWLPRLSRM